MDLLVLLRWLEEQRQLRGESLPQVDDLAVGAVLMAGWEKNLVSGSSDFGEVDGDEEEDGYIEIYFNGFLSLWGLAGDEAVYDGGDQVGLDEMSFAPDMELPCLSLIGLGVMSSVGTA